MYYLEEFEIKNSLLNAMKVCKKLFQVLLKHLCKIFQEYEYIQFFARFDGMTMEKITLVIVVIQGRSRKISWGAAKSSPDQKFLTPLKNFTPDLGHFKTRLGNFFLFHEKNLQKF